MYGTTVFLNHSCELGSMSKFRIHILYPNQSKQPFMRGILTHSLVQQGMDFEKAYHIAQTVRQRLHDQEELWVADLLQMIQEIITQEYGESYLSTLSAVENPTNIRITTEKNSQFFSKGLLAKSITASGVTLNQAHQIAQEVEIELRSKNIQEVSKQTLQLKIAEILNHEFGKSTRQMYEFVTKINDLDKPVIIFLGGAVGIGKSTLAAELATRLGIIKVTGTDMIREIMRISFARKMLPSLHYSTFEAHRMDHLGNLQGDDRLLAGFDLQCSNVCVGVEASVQRALRENVNMVIEGVHLLPYLIQFPKLQKKSYLIPLVVSLVDQEKHFSRFEARSQKERLRKSRKYEENFTNIRIIHDYFLEIANQYGVSVIDNADYDAAIHMIIHKVSQNLRSQLQ